MQTDLDSHLLNVVDSMSGLHFDGLLYFLSCRGCCSSCYVQLQNCLAASHWSKCRNCPADSATHHSPDSGALQNFKEIIHVSYVEAQSIRLLLFFVFPYCPQSRSPATTSTAVLPTVVAPISVTRTQSPVISQTVSHSPEVIHG